MGSRHRRVSDWYATKCVVDDQALAQGGTGPNHRTGELLIKQMGADDQEMRQVCLDLEELDSSSGGSAGFRSASS